MQLRQKALALAALAALSCAPRAEEPQQWNVLLVIVDTLRADRMSLYGYSRPTSPELERFAERAIVFDNTLSQAGCTFPSVNSLLTSRPTHDFLSRKPRRLGIPAEIPTLAEALGAGGYGTGAISASRIVRATPSRLNPFGGFEAGFDLFDEECERRGAACVRTQTMATIDALAPPFFVYAHFMEPHDPYSPPKWHERRFATARPDKPWVRRGTPKPIRDHLYRDGPADAYDASDVEHIRDLYDEEILHFDQQFTLLLRDLETRGLLDETILVLASDHGEALLEHGEFAHCRDIAYNSVLRTPLLIALPEGGYDAPAGRRATLAQNLDIAPTLLDLVGVAPPTQLAGESLRAAIENDQPVHRFIFSGQGVKRVITDGRYKLIYDLATETSELYNWVDDPHEETDLAAAEGETVESLQRTLLAWVASVEGEADAADRVREAQEIEEQLRAVGYL